MTITVSNNKPTIFSKFISSGQQIYLNQDSDFHSEKNIDSIYNVFWQNYYYRWYK